MDIDKKTLSMTILVVGIVILVISVFADNLGIGDSPGFGRDQLIGSVFGAIVVVVGVFLSRTKKKGDGVMVRLGKLSKWAVVVLAALMLGYFTLDKIVLSPQKQAEFDGSVTLSWTVPTENEDMSPLTDLAGYIVHYGTQAGQYSNTIRIDDPKTTSYTVENLSPGTYYFAITTINTHGDASTLSNMIAKTVP